MDIISDSTPWSLPPSPTPERWKAFALKFFQAGNVTVNAEEGHQTRIYVNEVIVSDDAWWDIIIALVALNPEQPE